MLHYTTLLVIDGDQLTNTTAERLADLAQQDTTRTLVAGALLNAKAHRKLGVGDNIERIEIHGRDSADTTLLMDAAVELDRHDTIDRVVVVSSDQIFYHLIRRAELSGRVVEHLRGVSPVAKRITDVVGANGPRAVKPDEPTNKATKKQSAKRQLSSADPSDPPSRPTMPDPSTIRAAVRNVVVGTGAPISIHTVSARVSKKLGTPVADMARVVARHPDLVIERGRALVPGWEDRDLEALATATAAACALGTVCTLDELAERLDGLDLAGHRDLVALLHHEARVLVVGPQVIHLGRPSARRMGLAVRSWIEREGGSVSWAELGQVLRGPHREALGVTSLSEAFAAIQDEGHLERDEAGLQVVIR